MNVTTKSEYTWRAIIHEIKSLLERKALGYYLSSREKKRTEVQVSKFFVPYTGARPAAISVNGHKLIILSRDKASLEDELEIVGADSLRSLRTGNSREEETRTLDRLARTNHAGVVIAPGDVDLKEVIKNLEVQLPWLH